MFDHAKISYLRANKIHGKIICSSNLLTSLYLGIPH